MPSMPIATRMRPSEMPAACKNLLLLLDSLLANVEESCRPVFVSNTFSSASVRPACEVQLGRVMRVSTLPRLGAFIANFSDCTKRMAMNFI